jgi:hypothetical protein
MNDDQLDSELDAIIDSCLARQRDAKAAAASGKADDENFYQAWNEHRATIVEPALQEIAAKLQGRGIQVEVRKVRAHHHTGMVIENTSGIALCCGETSLSFTPMGRSIGVVYPPVHQEMLDTTKITREFVRQMALAFLKKHVGPGARR